MVLAVVSGISAVFLAIGIPSLVAGIGLLKHKAWARVLAIIVAILAVTSFPIGTAAGLYAFWVLTHKETEQLLAAAP
jgi:cytochrome c biogenesis protein CcdA